MFEGRGEIEPFAFWRTMARNWDGSIYLLNALAFCDAHGGSIRRSSGKEYSGHDNMVKRNFAPLFAKLEKLHAEDPATPEPPERFNWHALRHFAISCWIEADLKPKTVQTFAGHSSLQVTMDIYGHLFKSDDHKAAMNLIATDLFG